MTPRTGLWSQVPATAHNSTPTLQKNFPSAQPGAGTRLAKIQADDVTPLVLESYVTAVEQRVAKIPEFVIPLRLFRYGIRYLISHKESEFVELIKPERRILRQALGLEPEA